MDILDGAFRRMGGRWNPTEGSDLAKVEQYMVAHIRRTQQANYDQVRNPIEFGFVNNGSFNAFATVYENTDVIGMHLSLLFILNSLFLAMMSYPDVLPKVGNASAERPKLYDPTRAFVDIFSAAAEASRLTPNDPIRSDYAQKLSWIVRMFILEHEACHLFNRHVDWRNDQVKSLIFDEIGVSLIPGISSLDLQTLEMDADCYGATHATLEIFRNGGPSRVLANPHMNTSEEALYAI